MFNKKQNSVVFTVLPILLLCLMVLLCFVAGKVAAGVVEKDTPHWASSYLVANENSTIYSGFEKRIPLNSKENCELINNSKPRVVIFTNSADAVNDCLELRYVMKDFLQAGIGRDHLNAYDVSGCNAISFCVKGGEGNETVKLWGIKDDSGNKILPKLDITPFTDGSIKKEWQTVVIPLSEIPGADTLNLKNIKILMFSFGPRGEGEKVIYLDNIMFIKQDKKEVLK